MADIAPVVVESPIKEHAGFAVIKWPSVKSGDVCLPYRAPLYPDRSVQITGTLSGASVAIKGDNHPDFADADPQTLKNTSGIDAVYTAACLDQVVQATFYTLPVVTGGDANTDIDILMLCVTARGI
jgi:hypothetical protein